jgi:O-antigen ligase
LVGFGFAAAGVGLGLYILPEAWQLRILTSLSILDYPDSGVLRYLNDDPARLQRATGTSIDPNAFGGLVAILAALLVPQLSSRQAQLPRRLTAVMLSVMVAALLASVSRGSLVGFAAGLMLIGLVRDRRWLLAGLAAFASLAILSQTMPWSSAYIEHFASGLAGQDRATAMRFGEYRDALRLIERYPWFGVGFGSPRDVDLYRGVSSLYLILAETMGLVGLGAFAILLGAAGTRLLLAWNAAPPSGHGALLLGCLASLSALATAGLVDHYAFTYPHAFSLLWLILALGMRAIEMQAEEAEAGGHDVGQHEETGLAPSPAPSLQGGGRTQASVR